jgi:hypothetical protein
MNYLNHVKQNNSEIVTNILDKSHVWKGGSAREYKQHLSGIQAMVATLQPRCTTRVIKVSFGIEGQFQT